MEGKTDLTEIIETLREHAEKICQTRQELQKEECLMKSILDRLNLHCSADWHRTTVWREKEDIMNAFQKAREDRDEYKFQLDVCNRKIKQLKEELNAGRLNQTQHNISIAADISRISGGNSSACNTKETVEDLKRELAYLHKINEEFLEQIRMQELKLSSQEGLLEKLCNYEEEIPKLKSILVEKEAKMMDMQIKFDEKIKNSKRDFTFQVSELNSKILELEKVRAVLGLDLETAHEEIRLLKLKKPVEETVQHSNSMEILDMAVTSSEQTEKETSHQQEEPWNVNTRHEKRGQLQAIENIMEHENSNLTSLSEHSLPEEQQDEVKELGHGVNKETKRGPRRGKGAKKEIVAAQKPKAKKMKTSDEKNTDPFQNIKTELTDESSSNRRKLQGTRSRAVLNPRRKAADNSKGSEATNKQTKKLTAKQETDENMEPCSLESNSFSFNTSLGKTKRTEDTSTPLRKPVKKVQDDNKKRTHRRRIK